MGRCCENDVSASWRRRIATLAGWIVPATVLALVPKCPVCVATYAAALTGIGISISAATFLRTSIILAALAILVSMSAIFLVTTCRGRRNGKLTGSE